MMPEIAETLAHLEYLVSEGRLDKLDGKVVRYCQIESGAESRGAAGSTCRVLHHTRVSDEC